MCFEAEIVSVRVAVLQEDVEKRVSIGGMVVVMVVVMMMKKEKKTTTHRENIVHILKLITIGNNNYKNVLRS